MKIIILAVLITAAVGFPFAGNVDLGKTTKNMTGKDYLVDFQVVADWFREGDIDNDGYLTHEELFRILSDYSGSDVSNCHLSAALMVQKGDSNGDRKLSTFELFTSFSHFVTESG